MYEKVRKMIAERLSIDEDKITLDSKFFDDLDADSLDLFELVMAVEDMYGIEIPTDDLDELLTVGAFIEYLKAHGIEEK